MLRYLHENVQTIKWDHNVGHNVFIVRQSAKKLKSALGREPTIDEIAADTRRSSRNVRHLIKLSLTQRNLISLDCPVPGAESESDTFAELVEDQAASAESVALEHEHDKLIEILKSSRAACTPKEWQLIELRHGFVASEGLKQLFQRNINYPPNEKQSPEQKDLSVRQTAQTLGRSKSAVQRAESKALRKLRKFLETRRVGL